MRNPQPKLCAYCGGLADTADHIPPKAIVPAPVRNNIIVVPACRTCNNGFSKDDEYLMALSLVDGTQFTQDARPVEAKVLRWLEKPNKKRQFFDVFEGLRHVEFQNRSGRKTRTMTYRLDSERLLRQCDRFLRALYYHLREEPLPEDFETICAHPEDPTVADVREKFRLQLASQPFHTVGNDSFRYRYRGYSPEVPGHFIFQLVFFDSVSVFGQISLRAFGKYEDIIVPGTSCR